MYLSLDTIVRRINNIRQGLKANKLKPRFAKNLRINFAISKIKEVTYQYPLVLVSVSRSSV